MPLWLSALIIAVPTFFYVRFVQGVDRFEKEPKRYLIAAFLWGAIPGAFTALPRPSGEFYQLAGELSLRKHRLVRYGEIAGNGDIDQLRARLQAMSYGR